MSILRKLYFQVFLAVVAGVAFGHLMPEQARSLKWLGDAFVALVRMVIAPIIFCTIVHGIASMGDLRKVGRVGVRALLYFEAVSTLALVTGAVVGIILRPGVGFGADVATLDPAAVAEFASAAAKDTFAAHLLSVIPRSYFDAMAQGDLLQVLLIAILTGVAITGMGDRRAPILAAVDLPGQIFSGSSAWSCGSRRWEPSGRWRSRSAATASPALATWSA